MSAMDRRRTTARIMVALATVAVLAVMQPVWAQQGRVARTGQTQPARPEAEKQTPLDSLSKTPTLKTVVIPVNPEDPVATINGQVISRRRLADECVARKGPEILETMIARGIIEQALKAKHLEVTPAEIDAEVDNVAKTLGGGLSREAWLRSLDKQRGISPVQYSRDIIYPTLALKKLASPQVQVTAKDMKDAFEAHFGQKLRIRLIMCDKLRAAQEIWEELKRNPGGFEKIAQERSIDMTSRSLGGLIGEPITRHAYPPTVSDAAFQQLVDGDPKDKDPAHKPKDGDFTGPIQVSESSWVIIRREGVTASQNVDPENPTTKKMIHDLMFDAKLKAKMGELFQDLYRAAAIENKLTGQIKLANEEQNPDHHVDGDVKLMSNPSAAVPQTAQPSLADPQSDANVNLPPPAGVSPDVAKKAEVLKRPLKPKP